ncbi:MAG: phosphatase PAP2 family protein [Candidatus Aenigmarchaeota archaeon]|nr:phosphatase PAP2 family protein [Candidatus Aenigmarchaeota archaeon]
MSFHTNPWYIITLIGEPEIWLALSGVFALAYVVFHFAFPKRRKPFRNFLLVFLPSLWLTVGLVVSMKVLVPVERPCIPATNPYCDIDPSFPSAHAATAFSVFTSLHLAARKRKTLCLYFIPVLVAASRIALGVHTPADVIAGAAIGMAVPVAALKAQKYLFRAWKIRL